MKLLQLNYIQPTWMVRFYILHKIIAARIHSGCLSRNWLHFAVRILPICILSIFLAPTLYSVVCTYDNCGSYVMSTIDYIHRALLLMHVDLALHLLPLSQCPSVRGSTCWRVSNPFINPLPCRYLSVSLIVGPFTPKLAATWPLPFLRDVGHQHGSWWILAGRVGWGR